MTRWVIPTIYLLLCEVFGLLYELGLSRQISGTVGTVAVFFLIALTFPAMSIGAWSQGQIAVLLGISSTDAIAYNSFWPRFAGWQSSTVVCAFALALIAHLAARVFSRR